MKSLSNIQNQDITYNAYNLIDDIKEKDYDNNTNELKFYYGTDEFRNKMEMLTNDVVDSTKYYAGNYEVTTKTGENTFVRSATYIPSPTGLAAVFIKDSRDEQQPNGRMFYVLQDHLGSITALINEAGDLRQEFSYDVWGRRRHPDWQYFSTEDLQNFKPLVSRGYTGHEHLDKFGLINMNGRLYDPVLGRMLSPDNYIQNPLSAQSYNRYSYCVNNPLKYIDPSGEKITNNSKHYILIKPENGSIFSLAPGQTYNGAIDGFSSRAGVYKVINFYNNSNWAIDNNGISEGPTFWNAFIGGVFGAGFLSIAPDQSWNGMFVAGCW